MLRYKLIISLIGIYIFWLFILPQVVSRAIVSVCENYSHNSNYNLEVKNPQIKLSLLPIGVLKVDSVSVKAKNESAFATVENVKVKVRLLPLLSGRVHINNLSLGKAKLSAKLVEELELDKDFFNKLENTPVRLDGMRVGEFEALLYQKDIESPIIYNGKGFVYERKNRYVKLHTNSALNVNGKISKVTSDLYLPKNNDINKTVFDVEVANIDLAPLRFYFKHYLPKDLKDLVGNINVKATKEGFLVELNNCAVLMQDGAKSMVLPSKMLVKSKFNITKNFIKFDSIDVDSKGIHANLEGKITDYFGKAMPTIDFNIRLNKSRVEDIVDLLPAFSVEEIDVYKLKKYKFYGETLANFSVKGRLPEPDVLGDIYIDDGVLVKPIPNTYKGATIKLNFTGRNVNFDVLVPAGNLEKVFVKGSQDLYNAKFANFTVKSTDNVDLDTAQDVLNPLHEVLNFVLGPVPIMDIAGKGNVDLIIKGNRKNPHLWGVFNVKNGTASFNDISNIIARNIDAVLKFSDQNVVFTTQKASLNNKDIQINGLCDVFGKFDFDAKTSNQPTAELYNSVLASPMFVEFHDKLPKFDEISGLTDLDLKILGQIKDFNNIKINENVFAKGNIKLKDNKFVIQNIEVAKANGNILFDNFNIDTDIVASIANLPLSIKGKIKNDIADLAIDIPKLNPNFLIADVDTRNKQYLPYLSVKGKYLGNINEIDYNKINLKATVLGSTPSSAVKYEQGSLLSVANNKIQIRGLKGYLNNKQNSFNLDLNINNAFDAKPDLNGNLTIKTPDLSLLNEVLASDIVPDVLKKYTKDYEFTKGGINLNTKIVNNRISAFADLAGISFVYLPYELPVEIVNGSLAVKNNTLRLNKINFLADKMPVLVDGEIKDFLSGQNFNLYFNSKPQQEFIDKYINKNQIYPIKIKGDIVYWVRAKGVPDNFDLKSEINMSKDSSFYHFGATIGDIENAILVSLDSKITNGNVHKIKEFSYDKLIDSQSGRQTRLNMLKAWGGVKILKEDLAFDNLRIKTNYPTDARVFNIIFRKPNIKQGQFTSDLKIDGKLSDAKVLGDFHIFETNIPFLDTTMKNIELVFKDKTIEFDSKGEIMGNDIVFDGVLKNKLTVPYKIERANFYTKDLNLNQLVDKLKIAEVDNVSTFESLEGFDLSLINAKNFKLKADNVQLRNIHATNFEAITSLSEKGLFEVNNFKFNIAQGLLGGKYSYNLYTNDMGLNLKADSISANDITWALFDLNNQIYGDLTGKVNLSCNGSDFHHCMETLSGATTFNVKDGKMPKLGSLEYLLKAGNLIKGGLTGLSINSVIDLLAPSKTGDFSEITGNVRIKDGVARNVEITTKGDDLSLFIGGTYNFSTSIADMEVLGLLSRKISTMFGPIGNVSINTLFNVIPGVDLSKDSLVLERINKIPAIELSSKAYRKFIAEIKGNINGEDYVTSFRWIN